MRDNLLQKPISPQGKQKRKERESGGGGRGMQPRGSGLAMREPPAASAVHLSASYLIYSESFNALPEIVKSYVFERINAVLSGADTSVAHLSEGQRQA